MEFKPGDKVKYRSKFWHVGVSFALDGNYTVEEFDPDAKEIKIKETGKWVRAWRFEKVQTR